MENPRKRVCVCVLGDIGRSPRMQYHSLSLSKAGFAVDIVAYSESLPHAQVCSDPNITIHSIDVYKNVEYLPRILNYVLKGIILLTRLIATFFLKIKTPSHILVQNPPSIPALFVVWVFARWSRSYFVIDWHNYGFSILSLSLGNSHPFVKVYRFLELYFGKLSDFNFCVSKSMQKDLVECIGKEPIVLYDRPYSFFKPLSLLDKHNFLSRFQDNYSTIKSFVPNETLFTSYNEISGEIELKIDSPIILVSSTSWTEDEDFQILLDALYEFDQEYASKLITNNNNLKVLCVITGKGPLKAYYTEKIQKYSFKHTKYVFPWLLAEDYPKMLASSNLGICLHKSSSGLDLPMKVVDMFGSRLPVCAFRYPSIHELVKEGKCGLLFEDSKSLVKCLIDLFKDYPSNQKLFQFKSDLEKNFCQFDWDTNWEQNALTVFKK